MKGFMEILSPGALSTIQDGGRFGYQGSGFPVSGCMDLRAYHDANLLLDNPMDAAVVEMQLMGINARFTVPTCIALTGADQKAKINGIEIPRYKAISVKAGDELNMGLTSNGRFACLAVAGGFSVPKVMGSYSTNLKCGIGGFEGRALRGGDRIEIESCERPESAMARKEMEPVNYESEITLHIIAGPQDDRFSDKGKQTFSTEVYTVSNASDRMGYRLEGPEIEFSGSADILSDGIVFGSIQVPASGKPIILMADRQTTGGYAKIGTVIQTDMPKLAQCMPGSKIRFEFVNLKEAEKISRREDFLKWKLRMKTHYKG